MHAAESATKVEEKELVRYLFGSRHIQFQLLPLLRFAEPVAIGFEVEQPIMPLGHRVTAELDALIVPHAHPEQALGVQCKRVTVPAHAFHTQTPGKLKDIVNGVAQANALLDVGFHRAYLAVIVQVDGREASGGRWADGGLSDALAQQVCTQDALQALDPECGLLVMQIVQPVDRPIFEAGAVSPVFHRAAARRLQHQGLTSRLIEWLHDTAEARAQATPISTLDLLARARDLRTLGT